MADFEKAIPVVLAWEGGYVNNPADPGGETNRGITFRTWQQFAHLCGKAGTSDELKILSIDDAKTIYRSAFWSGMHGDEIIDQNLALQIFDTFVNCGNAAISMLQNILRSHNMAVGVDGVMGPITVRATNAYDSSVLARDYLAARIHYYNELPKERPSLSIFLVGWLRRAERVAQGLGP